MQQGKWVDARKCVALLTRAPGLEQARLAALEQLPQPVAALSAEAARAVHDAALPCFMLRHLPRVRLYVLRTSAHCGYSGPCQDEAYHNPSTCPSTTLVDQQVANGNPLVRRTGCTGKLPTSLCTCVRIV